MNISATITFYPRVGKVMALVVTLPVLLSFTACQSIYESISGQDLARGNAIEVTLDQPPSEAISRLQSFLESEGFQISTSTDDTFKTNPKEMSAVHEIAGESEQTVRVKAVAQSSGEGSEIMVVADYEVPATGEWLRARVSDGYDIGTPAANALKKVEDMLRKGYGGGGGSGGRIERASADVEY